MKKTSKYLKEVPPAKKTKSIPLSSEVIESWDQIETRLKKSEAPFTVDLGEIVEDAIRKAVVAINEDLDAQKVPG